MQNGVLSPLELCPMCSLVLVHVNEHKCFPIPLLIFVCTWRGQVRLVHGSGATGLQLVQSYSDSDEDSDGAWEGRLGDRYNPPGKPSGVSLSALVTFNPTFYFVCKQWKKNDQKT